MCTDRLKESQLNKYKDTIAKQDKIQSFLPTSFIRGEDERREERKEDERREKSREEQRREEKRREERGINPFFLHLKSPLWPS